MTKFNEFLLKRNVKYKTITAKARYKLIDTSIKIFVISISIYIYIYIYFFFIAAGDDGCSFTKNPDRNVFVIAGNDIELEWILAVDLTKYPNSIVRIKQPEDRILYGVLIKTNEDFAQPVLLQKPFSKRIKWTGNTTQNKLSFLFSNVTRDLALKYFIDFASCGQSVSQTMELHVLGK